MDILLTGSSGFVGNHLTKRLSQAGYTIHACNTTTRNLLKPIKQDEWPKKIDHIIHTAAWTRAGSFCLYNSGNQFLINQRLNTAILDVWHNKYPQARFIGMGTSCAYSPELSPEDKIESRYLDGYPYEGLYTYAMTKRMVLVGLQSIHKQFQDHKFSYIIPNTIIGPEFPQHASHFIFDLIRKIVAAKLLDVPLVLWGDGHQKRAMVYIDDVVDIIMKQLDPSIENTVVKNITSGVEYSIREYAELICDYVGYDHNKVVYDRTQFRGVDSTLIKAGADLRPFPVDKAIKNTIDYHLEVSNV